jgi:hypothetical protein
MAKINPLDAADVVTPPPWERAEFHYSEVPAVVKRLYGFTVRKETVYRWITKGKEQVSGDAKGSPGFLDARKIAGRWFVRMTDLKTFLEAT